jgi:predicted Zn-dependent protease
MLDRIKKCLSLFSNDISDWKISSVKTEGRELFFIGNSIDMVRAKQIEDVKLTVYRDFKFNLKSYRGSATSTIHPTMSDQEMEYTIRKAVYASSFVKNERFPIVNHVVCVNYPSGPSMSIQDLSENLPQLVQEIYSSNSSLQDVKLNSCELFLSLKEENIINSKGLSIHFSRPSLYVECITQAPGLTEEIELYESILLSDLKEGVLKSKIMQLLHATSDRSKAIPLPNLGEIPVIISGDSVSELLQFYLYRLSARYIYENISDTDIGEAIQGEEVEGDKISLYLDPQLPGSYHSRPFDLDGFPLHKVRLIHQGIVEKYWGDIQYSHYIHTPPTGQFCNISVDSGSQTLQQMKNEPFLEIVAFSDFQMDNITSDFGGEIRLAYYYDGTKVQAVYGGSISGNLKKIQEQLILSKERRLLKQYYGPCSIKLKGVNIAGISE